MPWILSFLMLNLNCFQSLYQAIIDIVKREGVLGLYSGLNSSLLGIAVTNGCVYIESKLTPDTHRSGKGFITTSMSGLGMSF